LSDSADFIAAGGAAVPVRRPRPRLTSEEHRRLARRYKARRALRGYAFLAPNLFFFGIFLLVPVGWVFYATLQKGGIIGPSEFVGLDNWREAFNDPLATKAMKNTVFYALMAIPAMFVIGMILALFLLNVRRGAPVFRALLYFPTLAPVVVAGLVWLFMVHPDFGALNMSIRAVGGQTVNWLGDEDIALPTIAMVEVWRGVGFWAIYFLAALLSLPRELYQAAHLDGAGSLQRFRHLTLPLLKPTLLFAVVLATIYNLQVFDTVFVMTDGAPSNATATLVWDIYKTLFQFDNVGLGATLSCLLLLVILALTLVQMRLLRARKAG
jgi:ABC-type sugar transport system permease subunit